MTPDKAGASAWYVIRLGDLGGDTAVPDLRIQASGADPLALQVLRFARDRLPGRDLSVTVEDMTRGRVPGRGQAGGHFTIVPSGPASDALTMPPAAGDETARMQPRPPGMGSAARGRPAGQRAILQRPHPGTTRRAPGQGAVSMSCHGREAEPRDFPPPGQAIRQQVRGQWPAAHLPAARSTLTGPVAAETSGGNGGR